MARKGSRDALASWRHRGAACWPLVPLRVTLVVAACLATALCVLAMLTKSKYAAEVYTAAECANTRGLVFAAVGRNAKHETHWLSHPEERRFDVYLVAYEAIPQLPDRRNVRYYEEHTGTKPILLKHALGMRREVFTDYDAVFVVDDDIELDTRQINALFDIMCRFDLQMAAPAYTSDSQTSWPTTVHKPGSFLRFTNFVEVGVTILSRAALATVASTLDASTTGYGLDFAWAHLVGHETGREIAVLDAVQCRHPPRASAVDRLVPRAEHRRDGQNILQRYGLNDTDCDLYPVLPQYLPRVLSTVYEPWRLVLLSAMWGAGAALGVLHCLPCATLCWRRRRSRAHDKYTNV